MKSRKRAWGREVIMGLLLLSFLFSFSFLVSAQEAKVDRLTMSYTNSRSAFTAGVNPVITVYNLASGGYLPYINVGILNRNGFGYPTSIFTLTSFLGFDYRGFLNVPRPIKVQTIANSILRNNPDIGYSHLVRKVKKRIDPGVFVYFQLGTEVLIIPKVGFGFFIPVWESGFVDLGLFFPLVLNAGLFVTF